MKKNYLSILILLFTTFAVFSQNSFQNKQMEWTEGWTDFSPNATAYPNHTVTLPHIIKEDMFLTNDTTYLISGDVYVTNFSILHIQAGTVIKGDSKNIGNLIITKGAKLIADGTKEAPIVFTSAKLKNSRKSGDWGGITIIGSGNSNVDDPETYIKGNFDRQYTSYGGYSYDQETTVLRYVRIEFAGKHTNGLSFYGIGKRSIIENIMVSYSADDSFEWTAGAANGKNLISLKAKDDDFDFTQGFQGELTNILGIKHPYIASNNGSFALEIDGYKNDVGFNKSKRLTRVNITEATLITLADQSNYSHTRAAIMVNNLGELYLNNSKVSGFSDVVKFDKTFTTLKMIDHGFKMDNGFFNVHKDGVDTVNNIPNDTFNLLKYNRFSDNFQSIEEAFKNPLSKKNPDFSLKNALNSYTVIQ